MCDHCGGTGKTHGSDDLDCAFCNAADERAALESWVKSERLLCGPDAAWAIYQRGKQVQQQEAL